MKIILDTNFLIYCAKKKLDYIEAIQGLLNENYELVVPEQVVEELKRISKKKKVKTLLSKRNSRYKKTTGKDKDAASLALQLLDANKVRKVKVEGKNVDEGILNLARQNRKNIVATLDREMRFTLGRVILVNKQRRLMLTR